MLDLMRLREIYKRAREAMDPLMGLKTSATKLPTGVQGAAIDGVPAFVAAVETLLGLPLGGPVQAGLMELRDDGICRRAGTPVLAANEEVAELQRRTKAVTDLLSGVLTALRSVLGNEVENTVMIRLPPLENGGLDGMKDVLGDLSKAVELPLRHLLNVEIRVVGVDRGSAWVDVLVLAGAAIPVIKQLAETWQGYIEHKARVRQLEAEARQLDAGTKVLDDLASMRQVMFEKWKRAAAQRVVATVVPDEQDERRRSGEVQGIVENSIEIGAKLLQQGAAIDVRRLEPGEKQAPDARLFEAPESAKLLGDGSDDAEKPKDPEK